MRFQCWELTSGYNLMVTYLSYAQNSLIAKSLIPDQYCYALGACFGIKALENFYREQVERDLGLFLRTYFRMLVQWCPEKLVALVTDALAFQQRAVKEEKDQCALAFQCEKAEWQKERLLNDGLINLCKKVAAPNRRNLILVHYSLQRCP